MIYKASIHMNREEFKNNDKSLEETLINMLKCANSEFDTEKVVFEMKEEVFFTRGITVTASIEIK